MLVIAIWMLPSTQPDGPTTMKPTRSTDTRSPARSIMVDRPRVLMISGVCRSTKAGHMALGIDWEHSNQWNLMDLYSPFFEILRGRRYPYEAFTWKFVQVSSRHLLSHPKKEHTWLCASLKWAGESRSEDTQFQCASGVYGGSSFREGARKLMSMFRLGSSNQ